MCRPISTPSRSKRAQEALDALLAEIDLPAERKSAVARAGGIYHELLQEAQDWNADLIVVGSHRPVMSDYLLGSNAKTIVRHAQCSVLVVRESTEPSGRQRPHRGLDAVGGEREHPALEDVGDHLSSTANSSSAFSGVGLIQTVRGQVRSARSSQTLPGSGLRCSTEPPGETIS